MDRQFVEDILKSKIHQKWFPSFCLSAVAVHTVDKTTGIESQKLIESIPEPPPIPDASVEIVSQINALGESTFVSLGLGGWSPVGLVQHAFEYLHVTLGLPWWQAIMIGNLINCLCHFKY